MSRGVPRFAPAAVVIAGTGAAVEHTTEATDPDGYAVLVAMADRHSGLRAWAIEGANGYGAGLARFLAERGEWVIELDRPARPARRHGAKSDEIDAVRAAREALSREHLAQPRSDGERAALSVRLTARRSAVDASAIAQRQLHALMIAAPETLRGRLRGKSTSEMVRTCARLRVDARWDVMTRETGLVLRALARRITDLNGEARDHERAILTLVRSWRPDLLAEFGVGPIVAAVVLCAWSHSGRVAAGELDPTRSAVVRDEAEVMVGDVVATRRNLRDLRTDAGEMVRNRDRWTVTRIADDGALALSKLGQPGTVVVPRDTIELAYAVTEYGNQGDTHPAAVALVSRATSVRGLYVAMTRGRNENVALVITDTHDPTDARDILEAVLAVERVDFPATVQRRQLATAAAPTPERYSAPSRPAGLRPTPPLPTTSTSAAPPRQPTPVPAVPAAPSQKTRAAVPAWFSAARDTIVAEFDQARDDARRRTNVIHQRRLDITTAEQHLQHANTAAEPADAAVNAARRGSGPDATPAATCPSPNISWDHPEVRWPTLRGWRNPPEASDVRPELGSSVSGTRIATTTSSRTTCATPPAPPTSNTNSPSSTGGVPGRTECQ